MRLITVLQYISFIFFIAYCTLTDDIIKQSVWLIIFNIYVAAEQLARLITDKKD